MPGCGMPLPPPLEISTPMNVEAAPSAPACAAPCCICDPCIVPVLSFGFDAWHGVADVNGPVNFGLRTGINVGFALIDWLGIGAQAGISYGGYDWDGHPVDEVTSWQSQGFMTAGLFKRADRAIPVNLAVVYDYMVNDNYGIISQEPNLGQFRGMFSFPIGDADELGAWGTLRNGVSAQLFNGQRVPYTGINQYNAFWRHWFEGGSNLMIYGGTTDGSRHGIGPGSLGSWIAGASFHVPMSDQLAVYGDFAYLHPSATAGSIEAIIDQSYNVSVGIAWYPTGCLRARGNCNRGWGPMLPVANNGTFMVDAPFDN